MPRESPEKERRLERSQQIGITYQTFLNWERSGVDMFDDVQVKAKIRSSRKMPQNLKPDFVPQAGGSYRLITDVGDIDVDQLKLDMVNAPDKHTAQTIEIKIRGLHSSTKLAEAQGELVSKKYVDESLVRIGAATKAAAMRLQADLPPMLHGASMEDTQKLIAEKVYEFLSLLADQSAGIWEGLEND